MEQIEYFKKINIVDWDVSGNKHEGGQAKAIEVKNKKTNTVGIFRYLPDEKKNSVDIRRFQRELAILIDPKFKHKNIINILDHTKDDKHQWYISEKGDQIKAFWEKFKDQNQDNPEKIINKAIEIIIKISDGLILLHKNGIVHRDIKDKNIVIVNGEPVLIDFGLIYLPEEERLTPPEKAVGNARFSPDQMMYWQDDVPQWLDVFELSQLIIWLLSKGTNKPHYSRPLAWEWVKYPENFGEKNILKIRSVTALCSKEFTSPKDASEFKEMVENIFKEIKSSDSSNIVTQKILDAIATGEANNKILMNLNKEILSNQFPLFYKVVNDIISVLKTRLKAFNSSLIISHSEKELGGWDQELLKIDEYTFNGGKVYLKELLTASFGNSIKNSFQFVFCVHFNIPEKRKDYRFIIPDEYLNFWSEFTIYSDNHNFQKSKKHKQYYIYISNKGSLAKFDIYTGKLSPIDIDFVVNDFMTSIHDTETWEVINK